jgi:predicted NAD/FAD-dependent oxidoreductase
LQSKLFAANGGIQGSEGHYSITNASEREADMTTVDSQSKADEAPGPNDKRVAVVGGGIAGLTCALRLAQRKYKVTLYEKSPMLGGNLSSKQANGFYYDVYPHLFCDWYANFWQIVQEDLGLQQKDDFELRMGVKVLHRNPLKTDPIYLDLKNPSSLQAIWKDLKSGVLSPPDMFLVGFALLDLASQSFKHSEALERQTVNGFLYSRGYATEDCVNLHDMILMEIWSIHGSDTSADAYRDFVKHCFGFPYSRPFALLLKGSLEQKLIRPWRNKLESADCNCTIKCGVEVTNAELADKRVRLTLRKVATEKDSAEEEKDPTREDQDSTEEYDNVVMAVPAPELARLVMSGTIGARIVDRVPELSQLRQLRTARIPVVNLHFKEKLLPKIPSEHVGLAKSTGYLTFLDISQLWTGPKTMTDHTVVVLAASDAFALPYEQGKDWAYMMIKELEAYLPAVKPGNNWGDNANSNIDYNKSWYQADCSRQLFLNDVDSSRYQPVASYPRLPNVFFAGDFCKNDVKMSTVEGAVVSGLEAASALQTKIEGHSDITTAPQPAHSRAELLTMRLALLPIAYGATAWSTVNFGLQRIADGEVGRGLLTPAVALSLIPFKYATHWWGTIEALGIEALSPRKQSGASALQLAARGVLAAGNYLHQIGSELGETGKPPKTFLSVASGLLKAVEEQLRDVRPSPQSVPKIAADGSGKVAALQSAVDEGSGLLPGSKRYR